MFKEITFEDLIAMPDDVAEEDNNYEIEVAEFPELKAKFDRSVRKIFSVRDARKKREKERKEKEDDIDEKYVKFMTDVFSSFMSKKSLLEVVD